MLNENLENNLRTARNVHCVKHEWWATKRSRWQRCLACCYTRAHRISCLATSST